MLSITAVLWSGEFGLQTSLGVQWVGQISTGREDFACRGGVLPTLSEGLRIELPDFDGEDATLQGDYLLQVVNIVIGDVPTVLEFCYRCLFISLGRILMQGSESMCLFQPMTNEVHIPKVEVGI
jgi:hypothetical protein